MSDSAPSEGASREPPRDCVAGPASRDSGPTEFLAIDPTDAGVSREALSEAVRLLIRERDYLRKVREVQVAEARGQLECLARDRDALRQDRDELRQDRDALRQDRDELRLDRDTLRADREAWRARATAAENWLPRRISGWVKRILLGPFRRDR